MKIVKMLRPLIANLQRQCLYQRNGLHTQGLMAAILKNHAEEDRLSPDGAAQLLKYTPEESAHILKIVNHQGLAELLGYKISKGRAQKLVTWRDRNGPLQSIQDVLRIDGFSLPVTQKLCKDLLKSHANSASLANAKQRTRTTNLITPSLDIEQQQAIRSVVALRIGVASITWARLELPPLDGHNAPCELTHWQHHDIADKKLHIGDLVQRCLYVNHLIPAADCYIFENPQVAQATNPGNAEQQNISIQKAQITAMMGYALAARSAKPQAAEDTRKAAFANVFYLRRFLAARLFNHLVGTERVSSEETVLQLMRTHYNLHEKQDFLADDVAPSGAANPLSMRRNVQFPDELRQAYAQAERVRREFLGQALLINLAFVRLVLLQDAQSVALITRNSKKDPKEADV